MIITTTTNIEGREILSYETKAFGEVITSIKMQKDLSAGLRNVFSGSTKGHEDELFITREEALQGM